MPPNATSPIIHLEPGLEIGYGAPIAGIKDTTILGAGTHFLLARNGRGKTTLLRTLAGTLKPVAGELRISGSIQYLPEDLRFDGEITPELIFKTLIPRKRQKEAVSLAKSIELDVKKPYGKLSTGNRRKTSLIMAEFSIKEDQGNVLLFDEPFSGLDAFSRQAFEDIWKNTSSNILRLVSCHPDYDSMLMPSAILIEGKHIHHQAGPSQTWSNLKTLLN